MRHIITTACLAPIWLPFLAVAMVWYVVLAIPYAFYLLLWILRRKIKSNASLDRPAASAGTVGGFVGGPNGN